MPAALPTVRVLLALLLAVVTLTGCPREELARVDPQVDAQQEVASRAAGQRHHGEQQRQQHTHSR